MEQKTLSVKTRTSTGKGSSGRERRAGRIPAIIYGKEQPLSISVDSFEFGKKFRVISENTIIRLDLENGSREVIVKDYQDNILSGKITHLDFYEIDVNKPIRTHVPVHLDGVSASVKEGGVLEHHIHEVEIECLPRIMPERIPLDISSLIFGHSLRVSDLLAPEGVKILTPMDHVVASVTHHKVVLETVAAPTVAVVEGAEGAAAAPVEGEAKTETKEGAKAKE